jgi:tripartite-type tricarboxylate transporter receptor subunit TctC
MLKKFLLTLFCALTFSVQAETTKVYGVWGFTPGSTQGSYIRAILEESNKIQKKYEFIFENKPGAGSYIAAKSVLERKNALLSNSAAQFVRPYLYPETAWKFNDFTPIMLMGMNPAALVTSGRSLDDLVKQSKISLATSGTGSSTHLMAEVFAKEIKSKYPNIDVAMVHFKDTNEAFMSVMGGHTDATFEFLGDAKAKSTPVTRLLGLTGGKSIEGLPTLRSLGYPELSGVQGIFAWYAPTDMPNEQVLEFQRIFLEAEKAENVQRLYRLDYASRDNDIHKGDNLNIWYQDTIKRFKNYTQGIEVK